ncbi:hypothetical protein GGI15_000900 [Coemansia interrupta]|uniref:Signal recognition particle subunit SRP14 n=1 Tax=Coemansia interrupta TaxID=1126814 RepID=A0A9W8HRA3_9FUNG|nr:hypothetical protein GGI15_000900 [Coemansia interrupta]
MLLDNDEFIKALPNLFAATKEKGSVALTLKRFDFEGVKQERQKKRAKTGSDDDAMRLLLAKGLSLDDKEYATLVRAATDKKKLSTLVAPADLDKFLAAYHGVLLANVENMKRRDRLRKKKASAKRQAALKARQKSKNESAMDVVKA